MACCVSRRGQEGNRISDWLNNCHLLMENCVLQRYDKWLLTNHPHTWSVVLWQSKGNYSCSWSSIQVDSTKTNKRRQHEWLSSYLRCQVQKCPIFKKWIVRNVLLPQIWVSIIHLTWDNTSTNTNNLMQVPAYIYTYPTNQKLLTVVSSWHISAYTTQQQVYVHWTVT